MFIPRRIYNLLYFFFKLAGYDLTSNLCTVKTLKLSHSAKVIFLCFFSLKSHYYTCLCALIDKLPWMPWSALSLFHRVQFQVIFNQLHGLKYYLFITNWALLYIDNSCLLTNHLSRDKENMEKCNECKQRININ